MTNKWVKYGLFKKVFFFRSQIDECWITRSIVFVGIGEVAQMVSSLTLLSPLRKNSKTKERERERERGKHIKRLWFPPPSIYVVWRMAAAAATAAAAAAAAAAIAAFFLSFSRARTFEVFPSSLSLSFSLWTKTVDALIQEGALFLSFSLKAFGSRRLEYP